MKSKSPYVNYSSVAGQGTALGSAENLNELIFEDVTARIFPLRANARTLQDFIDRYLNREDYCHDFYFRVASPFVYMELINYGKMIDPEVSDVYTTQRELLFMVPLEWYVDDPGGSYRFSGKRYSRHEYFQCFITPFIFVDNPLSVLGGREVYGWPKSLMAVVSQESSWMEDPVARTRLVTIGGMRLTELFADQPMKFQKLFEIDRVPAASISVGNQSSKIREAMRSRAEQLELLFNMQASMFEYLPSGITRALQALSASQDPDNLATLISLFGKFRSSLARAAGTAMNPLSALEGYIGNSIGLKQFKSSDSPGEACYLAIANSRSEITKVHGGGMLGSIESMMSSITGGYSIKIHCYRGRPIVETLGLVTEEVVPDPESGIPVATLNPIMPFWAKVDFSYMGADPVIVEATHHYLFTRCDVPELPVFSNEYSEKVDKKPQLLVPGGSEFPEYDYRKMVHEPIYNESAGLGDETISGPYRFRNGTLHVFGLELKPGKRDAFLKSYLNDKLDGSGIHFEPVDTDLCYLVITEFHDVQDARETGRFTNLSAHFHVPVCCCITPEPGTRANGFEEPTRIMGSVQVFSYGSNMVNVVTSNEVRGPAMQHMVLDAPYRVCLEDLNLEARRQPVYQLSALVVPRQQDNHETGVKPLISIWNKPEEAGDSVAGTASSLGPVIEEARAAVAAGQSLDNALRGKIDELPGCRMELATGIFDILQDQIRPGDDAPASFAGTLQGLGLDGADDGERAEALSGKFADTFRELTTVFALKQFRHAEEPTRACYQCLVKIDYDIDELALAGTVVPEPSSDPEAFSLWGKQTWNSRIEISNYISHPIVRRLGLVSSVETEQKYVLRPAHHLRIDGTLVERLGECLTYRVTTLGPSRGWRYSQPHNNPADGTR